MKTAATSKQYRLLHPLFDRIFCTPATSAPVERIFSQRLYNEPTYIEQIYKMTDSLLETLVLNKCRPNN